MHTAVRQGKNFGLFSHISAVDYGWTSAALAEVRLGGPEFCYVFSFSCAIVICSSSLLTDYYYIYNSYITYIYVYNFSVT